MKIDLEKFKIQLKEKTKETYLTCIEKVDLRNICGFALYSDTSAMSISVSLNLYDNLKELQEEEEGFDSYFKFTPGEWQYEMINAKEFIALTKMLQTAHFKSDENEDINLRNKIYNCSVEVLEELKNEKLFIRTHKDFVLMFAVSDFSNHELENEWFIRLNDKEVAEEFSNWLESEDDDGDF